MRISVTKRVVIIGALIASSFGGYSQDGEALFKQNCAACHKLGKKLVGPNLQGVTERRSEAWLLKFIKSSQSMIKSGDAQAVAISNEFNGALMSDFPNLSDGDIKGILTYIKANSPGGGSGDAGAEVAEAAPIEYTDDEIELGYLLFSGKKGFTNGGAACISCHNVDNDELIPGGLLAKDLTHAYARMGDEGLMGIIGAPPFPAMATAYLDHPLDSTEVKALAGFLKHADSLATTEGAGKNKGYKLMMLGGGAGVVVIFLLVAILWRVRQNNHTKYSIFKRQIKSK
jgi:cytochrome c551/c552